VEGGERAGDGGQEPERGKDGEAVREAVRVAVRVRELRRKESTVEEKGIA